MLKVFTIYDKKAQNYMRPFYCENEVFAQREIYVAMQNPQTTLATFSEDFDLYCLGTFDEKLGRFGLFENPGFVCSAMTCKHMNIVAQEEAKAKS